MKKRKNFFSSLQEEYLLTIRKTINLEEKYSFVITIQKLLMMVFSTLGFIFLSAAFLYSIYVTHLTETNLSTQNAKSILKLLRKIDSLERNIFQKNVYITSIRNILSGKSDITLNDTSLKKIVYDGADSKKNNENESKQEKSIDSTIRSEFEIVDKSYDALYHNENITYNIPFDLFNPTDGIIINNISQIKHNEICIKTKPKETVKSIANGVIIFASLTDDYGYVIIIQHTNNLLSIYKHNASLLKNVGDIVTGNEIIAIVGSNNEIISTGKQEEGYYLLFEIWHDNNPIDPKKLILF
ncbi:MAG: M23 family metallopeptidase [Chitinophagaceae bacterium]|nr:M23 family metallopeptidase [Chitinophagaceae bacterium]